MAQGYYRHDRNTLSHLHKVLLQVKPSKKPVWFPRLLGSSSDALFPMVDCDEVYPNIYIGDESSARNKSYLQAEGITHVLNTADGHKIGQVNTGSSYYENVNIKYLGLNLMDIPSENIQKFFYEGAAFIESAIMSGGKVLVHCFMGMSRSATIVCAYLMIKQNMTAERALTELRNARQIRPNDGFLHQLLELEKQLKVA